MNREDFLKQLFGMYPNSFNDFNRQIWINGYKKVLKENWNFNKLFDILLTEYTSIHVAPAPAWFNQYKSLVEPKRDKNNSEYIKELEKNTCAPTKEFLNMKIKLQAKSNKMKG